MSGGHDVTFVEPAMCPACLLRSNFRRMLETSPSAIGESATLAFSAVLQDLTKHVFPLLIRELVDQNVVTCKQLQELLQRRVAANEPQEVLISRTHSGFVLWLALGLYLGAITREYLHRDRVSETVTDFLKELGYGPEDPTLEG